MQEEIKKQFLFAQDDDDDTRTGPTPEEEANRVIKDKSNEPKTIEDGEEEEDEDDTDDEDEEDELDEVA